MASNSTVFKTAVQISDVDRSYYHDHALTIARHPSETDERMMVRLLAFVLHADEALLFGGGLSTEDEPDLWKKDLTGAIDLWINVGQPNEKSVRQVCGRAKQVFIYTYGGHAADLWWEKNRPRLVKLDNLAVMNLRPDESRALAKLAQRDMKLQCTIQDGHVLLGDGKSSVQIVPTILKTAPFGH
jgi:uncharacterized protein YaeQ